MSATAAVNDETLNERWLRVSTELAPIAIEHHPANSAWWISDAVMSVARTYFDLWDLFMSTVPDSAEDDARGCAAIRRTATSALDDLSAVDSLINEHLVFLGGLRTSAPEPLVQALRALITSFTELREINAWDELRELGLSSADAIQRWLTEEDTVAWMRKARTAVLQRGEELAAALAGLPTERANIILTHLVVALFGGAFGVLVDAWGASAALLLMSPYFLFARRWAYWIVVFYAGAVAVLLIHRLA